MNPIALPPTTMTTTTTKNGGLRLRRTNSITIATANREERNKRIYQPDKPCHEPRDSLFSSTSGYTNYRGFLNLALIMLALSTGRVALENINKYGILADPSKLIELFLGMSSLAPNLVMFVLLYVFAMISFEIERRFAAFKLSRPTGKKLITINLIAVLLAPIVMAFAIEWNPVGASFTCGAYIAAWMKLLSYHQVNAWCRLSDKKYSGKKGHRRTRSGDRSDSEILLSNGSAAREKQKLVVYPENVNFGDLLYYMLAPTLCYELNFPRSQRIRKRFVIKRFIEMIFLIQLILFLTQQWIVPTVVNSLKPLQQMAASQIFERLLKLAIPNHFIWLLMFYWYFHSCLNFVAEILRFADRRFYRDWWNAETVSYFWQNWNVPVHLFCLRHIYKPLIARGYTKFQAGVAVFLVSAFFHEYLVAVPLRMITFYAFVGMAFQIPFAFTLDYFLRGQWANVSIWFSLIIGQPLCILACYHDYYVKYVMGR